jgi:hypothetical protein
VSRVIELSHVADLIVTVARPIEIGSTPAGLRRLIPITGGEVRGPKLRGRILPFGADFQTIRDDGVTELEAHYAIETDDGALIYISNNGLRHGPPDAMEKLMRGEAVDPRLIYFLTAPRFETAAKDYVWLNHYIFAGEGIRRPDHIELTIYLLL